MKQENDPVLAAIDKAKWDDEDLDAFNILSNCDRSNALLGANRQIEAIRTAYLASKQQPSDGGAFERVIAGIPFAAVKMFAGDIADITTAHNADRAADKQRIAELEAAKSYPCTLGIGEGSGNMFVHGDYESIKHLQGKLLQMEADKQRIAELDEQIENLEKLTIVQENLPVPQLRKRISELETEIEELKSQVSRVVI